MKETRVQVGASVSFQATDLGEEPLPDHDWDTDCNVNHDQGPGTFRCEWDFSYVYEEQPPNYGFNVEATAGVNATVQRTFNTAGTYIVKVRTNDVPPPGTWYDDSPRLGTSVTVYVGIPVWDVYPEAGGISCAGISAPLAGYGYACNSLVTCTIAPASDQDHRYDPATGQHTHPPDTFAEENAYVWSAEAGAFPNGNQGRTVTWLAPDSPRDWVRITCRVDDDADIPAGETGTRDDPYREYSVTVKVYKVRCLKVEATYNVDIYWPPPYDPPGFFDKVWAASVSTYQQDGTVMEDWPRTRIADVFHVEPPQQQHYQLTCTFYRYPVCMTDQELTTTVQFAGISGQTEVGGWAPQVTVATRNSVGRRSYTITFTFKVGGRQVENPQTIPQGEHTFVDFAIYGTPTCPPQEFTKDHLYFATDCGEGQAEEPDIAHKVLHEVNPLITSGCICNTSFENIWQGAKGPTKGGHSEGACCCRAKGMIEVLQVLGLGYVQDYVNELAEPNSGRGKPPNQDCWSGWPWHWGTYQRWALGGGNWNNWQGVCKAGNGATCYSPQGRHESVYEVMNDAPNYPDLGPGGTEYAFIQYAWIDDPTTLTPNYCEHLPTPP